MGLLIALALAALPARAFAQVVRVPSTAYASGSISGALLGGPAVSMPAPISFSNAGLPASTIISPFSSLPSLDPGAARSAVSAPVAAARALDSLSAQGEGAKPLENAPAVGSPVEGLPGYLSVADAEDRRWIQAALNAAARSRTARRVLAQVEAMTKAQGRPVMVEFADLRSNNGEYVYDWGMLRMALSYKKLAPEAAAPVFIHELLHAVQRSHRLPTDAVEMELEAHVVTIQVARELGLRFPKKEFSREAEDLLRESPEAFIQFVASSYSDNLGFGSGQKIAEFERRLFQLHARSTARIRRLESALSRRQATLERMKESGQPEDEFRSYERDVVGPAAAKLLGEREGSARIEADLVLLRDPESKGRYRSYARRVMALIRRAHLRLRSDK